MARFKIKEKPVYVTLKPKINYYQINLNAASWNLQNVVDTVKEDLGFEPNLSEIIIKRIIRNHHYTGIDFTYQFVPNEELEKLNYEKYLKDLAEYEKYLVNNLENINQELNRREQIKKEKILEVIKQKEKELESLRNKMDK